ncbi:hypothetical protein AB4Z17_24015 [Paenibacillus sp. TAF43_2]|uniref:hypothetical protein n=1 Tax=Paenibacillus sp. TAF43_2 TaxID=3233069 RepID=UPI003F9AC9BB
MKKTFKIILSIAVVVLVIPIASIPFVNNNIAYSIKKDLIRLNLPDKTEIIDAVSSAGKLVGNGNGMQFFGAILIKSELALEELNNFYSVYRKNDWSYIVEKQVSNHIAFIEHDDLTFKALNKDEKLINYYIVYTWGSSNYPLSDLDLRGH